MIGILVLLGTFSYVMLGITVVCLGATLCALPWLLRNPVEPDND